MDIYLVMKFSISRSVGILPRCNENFCHLCYKWHKFHNHRDSAENCLNALKIEIYVDSCV